MWEIKHSKPETFYDRFDRKGGDLEVTHYCPGCGHGVLHKLIAEAIEDLGIQDRTILVSPVGCSVFAYYYLDVGNVQAAHGRAPAVATGIKRVRPNSIVISYQGDGDLAAIGGNEILHAANRGENITVFFVNNGIYGMTGGQMAPTTPVGQRTTTSPYGRSLANEGYPMKICELLSALEAPAYIERVALTDAKHTMKVRKAVRRALQCQIEGRGFSLVEVLSACPTGWKATPEEATHWVEKNLVPLFPLKLYKERTGDGVGNTPKVEAKAEKKVLHEVGSAGIVTPKRGALASGALADVSMKISGFGGQGILFAGIALAEAGMREGLQVSWIPSYGPEMRGGTAHCHVRLSRHSIASPMINRPSTLIAFNEPSVDKFLDELLPGGLMMVNSSMVTTKPARTDIRIIEVPVTDTAKDMGNPKVANMVMLGAYLQLTRAVEDESVLAALAEHGLRGDLVELNRKALQAGRALIR
ncbi:MAG: 2-oxoacid:acceptor oxidoreductase family protein [Acidobacteriia bacterium]|nr:2-oxoacid:acceptor oxidoreductase family protein [Terriglobia bacterium]